MRNVDEDLSAYDELVARGFRTVPVTIVGTQAFRAARWPAPSGGDAGQIGDQGVGGLRQRRRALDDADLAEQVGGEIERVLDAGDLRERVVRLEHFGRDPSSTRSRTRRPCDTRRRRDRVPAAGDVSGSIADAGAGHVVRGDRASTSTLASTAALAAASQPSTSSDGSASAMPRACISASASAYGRRVRSPPG